ncbi:MAG: hypothetical protein WD750_05890 [Gammaproteobacteria bacterium]
MADINRDTVLTALRRHIGKRNGLSARKLVREIKGPDATERDERILRFVIVELRNEGYHIGAHPRCGYFICETDAELNETCLYLHDRAMTTLTQISAMKNISLPDLKGQLKLPT